MISLHLIVYSFMKVKQWSAFSLQCPPWWGILIYMQSVSMCMSIKHVCWCFGKLNCRLSFSCFTLYNSDIFMPNFTQGPCRLSQGRSDFWLLYQDDGSSSKLRVWVANVDTGKARPLFESPDVYVNAVFDKYVIFQSIIKRKVCSFHDTITPVLTTLFLLLSALFGWMTQLFWYVPSRYLVEIHQGNLWSPLAPRFNLMSKRMLFKLEPIRICSKMNMMKICLSIMLPHNWFWLL